MTNISLLCSLGYARNFPATNILLLCSYFKRQRRVNIYRKKANAKISPAGAKYIQMS